MVVERKQEERGPRRVKSLSEASGSELFESSGMCHEGALD